MWTTKVVDPIPIRSWCVSSRFSLTSFGADKRRLFSSVPFWLPKILQTIRGRVFVESYDGTENVGKENNGGNFFQPAVNQSINQSKSPSFGDSLILAHGIFFQDHIPLRISAECEGPITGRNGEITA